MASEPNGQKREPGGLLERRLGVISALVGLLTAALVLVGTLVGTGAIDVGGGDSKNGGGTPSTENRADATTPAVEGEDGDEGSPEAGIDLSGRWYEKYDRGSDFWDFALQDASSNTYEYVEYESNGDNEGAGQATVEQDPSGRIIVRLDGQNGLAGAFRADMTLTNDVLEVKEIYEGATALPLKKLFHEHVVPE